MCDTLKMLETHCEGIKNELESLVYGYCEFICQNCKHCKEVDDKYYCSVRDNSDETVDLGMDCLYDELFEAFDEDRTGEHKDLWEWVDDLLDIEYTISSHGDYLGAEVAVTLGGPNIYINTREGVIKGRWGSDKVDICLDSAICKEIDFALEDLYQNTCR